MSNESNVDDTETVEVEAAEATLTLPGDNVRRLLPVHAAPTVGGASKSGHALNVQRKVGRPRKVERMPTTSDLEYHAEMSAEKERFILEDPVVKAAVARGSDTVTVLKMIKSEVAKESAALRFQRVENEKYGKDTAQLSSRRIDALLRVANLEMEIKKLGAEAIDLRSERFQQVFQVWVGAIREAAVEVLPADVMDLFFNKLQTALDGWEERAEEATR